MAYIDNQSVSISALARNIADIGVNRDEILNYLIELGYVEDIRTITPLGEENGISYQYNEKGKKWPVYNSEIQKRIMDHFNVHNIPLTSKEEVGANIARNNSLTDTFTFDAIENIDCLSEYKKMPDDELKKLLGAELKKYYGENAEYRDGQDEAILGVLHGQRSLVVQRTGWGKSLVYFMATKMIRKKNKKITLIISPLLALMNNQIDSANKLGLCVHTINSTNEGEWKSIYSKVCKNKVDALIISPERLANENFIKLLNDGLAERIGLFVVDEAHCISDWGHDFRPDYRRIVKLINRFPKEVPVLATTATANDRVIEDIKEQLGDTISVSRGHLIRKSISIQTIHINSRESRMAWLIEHINKLPGTGVVYCLTVNDCERLSKWLNENGIKSCAFTGRTDNNLKEKAIKLFEQNKIKVLVATSAFGMGYDKADIGFVIHFQKPKDTISYYQQIGRAGREINQAYAILLYGDNDDDINNYFIESAFPTEEEMSLIVDIVKNEPGLTVGDIQRLANMTKTKIEGVLSYLEIEGAVYSKNKKYYIYDINWEPDLQKISDITKRRYQELEVMNQFARTKNCYMQFLAEELDDPKACACGKCSNCLNENLVDEIISDKLEEDASAFIKSVNIQYEPRKEWPVKTCGENNNKSIPKKYQLQEGIILCDLVDSEFGIQVLKEKYEDMKFSDETIDYVCDSVADYIKKNSITNVTYVPSINYPELVCDLAKEIANRHNLNFYESLERVDQSDEKLLMKNSYLQWEKADNDYEAMDKRDGNTLIIDDTVRSRWTLTCCAYKLLRIGNGTLYPFVLLETASIVEKRHDLLR